MQGLGTLVWMDVAFGMNVCLGRMSKKLRKQKAAYFICVVAENLAAFFLFPFGQIQVLFESCNRIFVFDLVDV